MLRTRLGMLAALLIGAAFPSPSAAQTDPRATAALQRLDPWLNSLVMIKITCHPGENPWTAAGVLIAATGEVLTAAHVGATCPQQTEAKVGRVRSLYSAPGSELSARLIHRLVDGETSPSPGQIAEPVFQDLALWKIEDMTGSGLTPVTIAQDFPLPGEAIEIAGFSGLPYGHSLNGDRGRNAGPGLTRFRTYLTSVGATPADVPYRLHYTGDTLEGVSGGPVFNARGELIGIHSTRATRWMNDVLTSPCAPDAPVGSCVSVVVPAGAATAASTVGVHIKGLKKVLDNYSWATSIFAAPETWLPNP